MDNTQYFKATYRFGWSKLKAIGLPDVDKVSISGFVFLGITIHDGI